MTRSETEIRNRYWQLERLSLISSHLSNEWKKRYEELIREFGDPPEDIGRAFTFRGGAYGEKSPYGTSEIHAMPDKVLLDAILHTTFTGKWDTPSAEGFANALEESAKSSPDRFAKLPVGFKAIRPSYLAAILRGLKAAHAERKSFSVTDLLTFLETLLTLDTSDPANEYVHEGTARLLDAILRDLSHKLMPAEGERIWHAIVSLFKRVPPESTAADLKMEAIDISDAVMNASRTARGYAAQAIISYLYWRSRGLGWDKAETAKSHCMNDVPEVKSLLEEYLAGEPSADIHPTIGTLLRLLHWIDTPWLHSQMPRIFPQNPAHRGFRDLAWCGYLNEQSVIIDVVRTLEPQYRQAIREIRDIIDEAQFSYRDATCASHVINYYLSGHIDIEDRKSLLALLFDHAPSRLMREVYEDFRRSLDEHDADATVLKRFRYLIEFRLNILIASKSVTAFPELKGIAVLICSSAFPPGWTAGHLLRILDKIRGEMESDHWIVSRMKDLAESGYISEVLQCFILLSRGAMNDWDIHSWEEELDAVFTLAMASDDPELVHCAKRLADKLGDRGNDAPRQKWFRSSTKVSSIDGDR